MNRTFKSVLGASALLLAGQAMAQITFYEGEGFRGRAFTSAKPEASFGRSGFNDRASSVIVDRGRWEVCDDDNFRGRCVILRPGNYDSLGRMGLNDRVSSMRPFYGREREAMVTPEPQSEPAYSYRRRPNERVVEVPVTSVHAVVGAPGEHCWVERQQVAEPPPRNVGGAIAGALIGGILGHQVGGGNGKDIATAGGAVAGGLMGSNVGRGGGGVEQRDVRRCEATPSATPTYWDVTYNYRGQEHRVQMSAAPGPTLLVNGNGEPRQ